MPGRGSGRRAAAAVVLAGVLAAACEWEPWGIDETPEEREYHRARARWESAEVRSYRYWLSVECDCPAALQRRVEIEVEDGVPVSVRDDETGAPADRALFAPYDTVDELFRLIGDALARDAVVGALYETRFALGYPESVQIDYDEFRRGEELSFVLPLELEILD
ncbi:MAG TPA: DUF6174 domain-containing protein [Longimicrobiaceae bacterium]|nr:DUF6174 domain-containing protein [Longimicrobiaceae bacterium]